MVLQDRGRGYLGNPERTCRPSTFWLMRYLRYPALCSPRRARWVRLGRASSKVVSNWGDSPFSSNVHTPLGPLDENKWQINWLYICVGRAVQQREFENICIETFQIKTEIKRNPLQSERWSSALWLTSQFGCLNQGWTQRFSHLLASTQLPSYVDDERLIFIHQMSDGALRKLRLISPSKLTGAVSLY